MLAKMKKCGFYGLALLLLASAAVTGWSAKAAAATPITSDFRSLSSSQVVSEMGAGWNLGNQLEASSNGTPSETAWGIPLSPRN